MIELETLPREDLIKLIKVYAKNWLAHDGAWFLSVEKLFNMETAIKLDEASWKMFAEIEARRIKKEFNIPDKGGLNALEKAFSYRLYAAINKQFVHRPDENRLIFKMINCRVQSARNRKGLPLFPCKSVGIIEFSTFARTIDPRIKTRVIACPPDEAEGFYCAWEFTLE